MNVQPPDEGYKPGIPPPRGSTLGPAYDAIGAAAPMAKIYPGQTIKVDGFDGTYGSTSVFVVGAKVGYTKGEQYPQCYDLNPEKQNIEVMAYPLSDDRKTLLIPVKGWVLVPKESILHVFDAQGKSTEEIMVALQHFNYATWTPNKQLVEAPKLSIVTSPNYPGGTF